MIVDFHSHILPGIDDGSQSVAESLALLRLQKEQGVEIVAATPHFYANHTSVEEFLSRRERALGELLPSLPADAPQIVPGAEVRYYEGISRLAQLNALRIGNSKVLLLEMPFSPWTEYTVRELVDLCNQSGLRPVLAHIERYLRFQNPRVWERLLDSGMLMQVNASFFNEFRTRRKAMRMLAYGEAHLIGSDCHNLTDRPPQLQKAYDLIRKKLGDDFVDQMNDFASHLLA